VEREFAFQSFGQVEIMTKGGPVDATNVIIYSIYQEAFENFRYMPVTRDLTPGARTLLYNFLNNPPAPAPKVAMLGAEQPEEPAAKEKVDFAKLNRNMRGNE